MKTAIKIILFFFVGSLLGGVIALCSYGQTFQRSLPFLAKSSAVTSPVFPSPVNYWWVYTDIDTNNAPISSWPDRNYAITWVNNAAENTKPVNTAIGATFYGTNSQLTNLIVGTGVDLTNTTFFILKRTKNNAVQDYLDKQLDGTLGLGYSSDNKNQMYATSARKDGTSPLNAFYDIAWVSYSNSCFICYTNGLPAYTNALIGIAAGWRYLGGFAGQGWFGGVVKEITMTTNYAWTAEEVLAAHQYATNTYGFSP